MKFRKLRAFCFVLAFLAGTSLRAAEITVFAAASLTDALKEIGAAYEKQSGDKIIFNFSASSTLARQIEEGAPADIFFSADEAKMAALEKKGLILEDTRKSRLSNSLVIVVPAEGGAAIESARDLATDKVKRLALAEPKTVPAGIYAKEYLQKQKLWPALEARVIPCENVRAALVAVESGNVEAGIVYKTDAAISKKVKVAYEVPRSEGPEIRYPMAVVKDSRNVAAARKLADYLSSPDAAKVFRARGFVVLE
jgi:molybdate transport system substrate-binding protein